MLYRAPLIWHFFDEVGERLAPPALETSSGMSPLWRRTLPAIISMTGFFNGVPQYGVDLDAHGRLAVLAGDALWLLDVDGGIPLHEFVSMNVASGWEYFSGWNPTIGFTNDGGALWAVVDETPGILDLNSDSHIAGPTVSYSWMTDSPSALRRDSWVNGSPAIGSDGTLYWNNRTVEVLALGPDGGVRWRKPLGGAGNILLDWQENVFLAGRCEALRASDGELTWRAASVAGHTAITIPLLANQRVGQYVPVTYLEPSSGASHLGMVGLDGRLRWIDLSFATNGRGGTFSGDGSLFFLDDNGTDGSLVRALGTADGMLRWEFRPQKADGGEEALIVGIAASDVSGKLYVLTGSGGLFVLDEFGKVISSYRLSGTGFGYPPVLREGVLFVASRMEFGNFLPPSEVIWPAWRRDGGVSFDDALGAKYGCVSGWTSDCGPPVRGASDAVMMLYAFAVE